MYSLSGVNAMSKYVNAIKKMAINEVITKTFNLVNLNDKRSSKVFSLSIINRYLSSSFRFIFFGFFFLSVMLKTKINKFITRLRCLYAKVVLKTVLFNFNY